MARTRERIAIAGTSAAAGNVRRMMMPLPGADALPVRKIKVMVGVNETNVSSGYPYTSFSSEQAFLWILQLVIRSGTSASYKFFLIHVQVPKPSIRNRIPFFGSSDEWPEHNKTQGEEFLDGFENRCYAHGIECERLLKRGCPEKEICEAVRVVEPDLLVLGNRGLGAFRRLYVKSVSEYCAKYAECPVIRIKRSARMANPKNPAED